MSGSTNLEVDPERLRALLKRKGMSQRALWTAVGIHPSTGPSMLSRHDVFEANVLQQMARTLDSTIESFTRLARKKLEALIAADIERLYDEISPEAFVWIFSTDGFIEADPRKKFYSIISSALSKGISIHYFFPHISHAEKSIDEFRKVLARLIDDHGQSITEQVKGFFIGPEGAFLYAQSSRFVAIGRNDLRGKRIERILLYVRAQQEDFWIEMDELAQRQDFVAEMLEVIDPVEHRPSKLFGQRWKLPPYVQKSYRLSFNKAVGDESYEVIRGLANTRETVRSLATELAQILSRSHGEEPFLKWLDVGCEDGANTTVVFDVLRAHHLNVSLTAIETSKQRNPEPILKYSAFLNDRSFEDFVPELPRDHKYDLITSIHSWYVIDPLFLLHAYRLLSENGVLLLVMAPYEENVFNEITHIIDGEIAERNDLRESAYPAKRITADPYRNYAEDIVEACNEFFGSNNIQPRRNRGTIERSLLINGGGLTNEAKSIVNFFCHRTITADQKLYDKVASRLTNYGAPTHFPCDEWYIVLERASIVEQKRSEIFQVLL